MQAFGSESWLTACRWWVVWVTGVGRIGYQSLPVGVWAVCPRRLDATGAFACAATAVCVWYSPHRRWRIPRKATTHLNLWQEALR